MERVIFWGLLSPNKLSASEKKENDEEMENYPGRWQFSFLKKGDFTDLWRCYCLEKNNRAYFCLNDLSGKLQLRQKPGNFSFRFIFSLPPSREWDKKGGNKKDHWALSLPARKKALKKEEEIFQVFLMAFSCCPSLLLWLESTYSLLLFQVAFCHS